MVKLLSDRKEKRQQRLKEKLEAEIRQTEIQEIIENILTNSQPGFQQVLLFWF